MPAWASRPGRRSKGPAWRNNGRKQRSEHLGRMIECDSRGAPAVWHLVGIRPRWKEQRCEADPLVQGSMPDRRAKIRFTSIGGPRKFVFLRAAFDRGRLPQEQVCIAGKSVHRLILGEWLVNCELEQIIANAKKTAPECDDVEQANENHGKTYRDSLPQLCLESDIRIGCVRRRVSFQPAHALR